jgi:hypothetical protein
MPRHRVAVVCGRSPSGMVIVPVEVGLPVPLVFVVLGVLVVVVGGGVVVVVVVVVDEVDDDVLDEDGGGGGGV